MMNAVLGRLARLAAAAMLAVGLTAGGALADERQAAERFLNDFGDNAIKLLANTTLTTVERDAAVRRLLVDNFDVKFLSRFVLSRHWRTATDEQKAEIEDLFRDYIVLTYGRRLNNYSGEKLALGQTRMKGSTEALTKSKIIRPRGKPVNVTWRLRKRDDRWLVVDVVVEGVSMAVAQRNEFGAVIRANDGQVSSLIDKLREITAPARANVEAKLEAKAS